MPTELDVVEFAATTVDELTGTVAVSVPAFVSLVNRTGVRTRHAAIPGVLSAQAGSRSSVSRSA